MELPRQVKDITGQKFGMLTARQYAGGSSKGANWLCQCDCGKSNRINGQKLRSGHTTSCGCKRAGASGFVRHGMSKSKTYAIWEAMIQRTTNPDYPRAKDYIGRGIGICDEWRSFPNFLKDMGEQPEGMTLDRRDNEKGYSADNCRWADQTQQNFNQRISRRNKSGKTGVCWNPSKGGWDAQMVVYGKKVLSNTYRTLDEAIAARTRAELAFSPNREA